MKRALCWIMSVILLLNSCPPAFAAGCNFESMLKDAYDPGWMNMECVRDFACYCREKKCAYTKPTQQGVEQFVSRFESIQREFPVNHEKLVLFHKAVASLNKTFPGKLRFTFPEDFTSANKETWTNLFDVCSGDEKKTLRGKVKEGVRKQVSSQQEEPNRFDFCFGAGENSNAELTAKITHLAEMEKDVLYNALAVMVNGGSADPKEPDYVHPLILNAAFFLYAKKITAAEQGNIEKYLPHQAIYSNIDPKYASRVQLAAASALFAFAKKNPQAIKPKFSLASSYATVQNTLSASGVMVGALSVSVSLSFWEAVAAAGGELSASAAEFTAAIKAAASAAKPGVAVVSSSPLGATVAVVGGVAIFVYALNDAYTPGYKAIFNRAKERFWNEVFSPEVGMLREIYPLDDVEPEEAIMRFVTVWTPDMAKLGDLTDMAIVTQTKKKKKPTCKYIASPAGSPWRLDKLHEYVNTGDPRSLAQLDSVRRCLGRYSFCPTDVADEKRPFMGCQPISLSSIGGSIPCSRDLKQLERVHEVSSSFYDADSGHKLFTRAIYKENIQFIGQVQLGVPGSWIPEAEIGIRFKNPIEDISRMFIQEIQDAIKQQLYGSIENISNTFSLGNYRSFRRGDHERNTKYRWNSQEKYFDKKQTDKPYQHFHYEEFLTYPIKNPYICNHSIYYPANH